MIFFERIFTEWEKINGHSGGNRNEKGAKWYHQLKKMLCFRVVRVVVVVVVVDAGFFTGTNGCLVK